MILKWLQTKDDGIDFSFNAYGNYCLRYEFIPVVKNTQPGNIDLYQIDLTMHLLKNTLEERKTVVFDF